MDLNQDVWDRLREQGHTIGAPHIQEGAGLVVVVDAVAMSVKDARALAHGHVTLAQIKMRISQVQTETLPQGHR
jgi:hypothetical protein